MHDAQRYLEARYASLRDARTGPVFFIEHGLAEVEIGELLTKVRAAFETHPLDSWYWDAHKLPLIVTATEVGYRYRGSGTDFWPVLEEEVGSHISDPSRQRIKNLFVAAAATFRGAHPPATAWAEAFHFIAWPITHALVPLEFHRSLAQTLANLRLNIAELDDETLYRAIRIAAASSSARFSTLLESAGLAVSVVRSLLGVGTGELSPEAIERITKDLAADQLARRSLAVARRVQRTAPARGRSPSGEADPIPPIRGTLQLRHRDRMLTLEASFPPIDPQLSSRLRRALRRRRFAPMLWGVSARVPSEQLLSGLPFPVKLAAEPLDGAALLPELEALGLETDLQQTLRAFELPLASPLLFAVGADKEVARLVQGPSISGNRLYWLVTSAPSSSLARFPSLGEIGPYVCYALDPAEESQCQALTDHGYLPRFGITVGFAGAPPLDRDAASPTFGVGDLRLVVPRRSYPEGLIVELNGSATRAADGDVVRVVVPKGDRLLRVSSGGETREFAFKGVPTPLPPSPTACVVDTRSPEMTVQALMNGSMAFSVESFAPLENLEVTVEFEAAARRLSASATLGPLPQIITSKHEPFATLLDDATRELLVQTPDPVLRLRVGNLCAREWTLERHIRPCWWVQTPEGGVALMSELGQLQYGSVSATAPHLPPAADLSPSHLETYLVAPVGLDSSEYGPAALFTTLCVAPRTASLEPPRIRKPPLQRRRRSQSGAGGLEDLVEAFLRWSLAEGDTVTAEIRRRQITNEIDGWIAEICCGATWRNRESEVPGKDAWELLLEIGHDRRLGRDSYFTLPEKVWREVLEVTIATIRHDLPGVWSLARPPCELTERDWLIVEAACDRAYHAIAPKYEATGRIDIAKALREADASADFNSNDWQNAFEAVLAQTDFVALAAQLLPTNTAQGIMALDPSEMSFEDICEELTRWARESQKAFAGDLPSQETIRAVVALWTEPEVAVNLDWRGALDTMISERSFSRAARYLALRHRQARLGGVA